MHSLRRLRLLSVAPGGPQITVEICAAIARTRPCQRIMACSSGRTGRPSTMLTPMLALILWTFVIEIWMYATRIPAMRAARIDPKRVKRKEDIDALPVPVKQIADNFTHLHEQPT